MKKTFLKLPPEKQERILNAFLREFIDHDYEHASLSRVVKELGIAKGSVYQYFGNKSELRLALEQICQAEKMKYVQQLDRDSFSDFWSYFREMFQQGMKFDLERPLHSQFLFRMSTDRSNPQLEARLNEIHKQSVAVFTQIIKGEQTRGEIDPALDPEFVAMVIVTQSKGIREYLDVYHPIDYARNLNESNTLFAREEVKIMSYVDQVIVFFRRAFTATLKP